MLHADINCHPFAARTAASTHGGPQENVLKKALGGEKNGE